MKKFVIVLILIVAPTGLVSHAWDEEQATCWNLSGNECNFKEDGTTLPDSYIYFWSGVYPDRSTIELSSGGIVGVYPYEDSPPSYALPYWFEVAPITGTTTGTSLWVQYNESGFTTSIPLVASTSISATSDSCNLTVDDISTLYLNVDFSISDCLFFLFFPLPSAFTPLWEDARNGFLARFPWGYVTETVDVFTQTATSTLPVLSYQFATSSVMNGATLSFDMNGIMTQATELINNDLKSNRDDSQTVWEILMPIITVIVYIVLLFQIIHDVTGVHRKQHDHV